MKSNVLVNLIRQHNKDMKETFDKAAECFIQKAMYYLDEYYRKGEWHKFYNCTQLGICIEKCSFSDPFEFSLSFGWTLWNETLEKFDECIPYYEYISDDNNLNKICGYTHYDIVLKLKPFVDALTQSGFKVFVNTENNNLIATINI